MAEVDKRHFHLCFGTDTVQLNVQIHMLSDSDFVSKFSHNQPDSDSNDSVSSDLNCSAVVEISDSEQTPNNQNIDWGSATQSMYKFWHSFRQLVTD